MSLVLLDAGTDPWLTEQESCEKFYREIVKQLNERSTFARNSEKHAAASGAIRLRLKQYGHEVNQLRQNLQLSTSLTYEEKERRQRLVEDLESKNIQLLRDFRVSKELLDRGELLNAPFSVTIPDREVADWLESSGSDKPLLSDEFIPSVESLKEDQKRVLEDQDRGLDNLSKVISRQKNIAITIGTEVDLHNDLLDDISTRMETTSSSIHRETVSVRVISDKDSTYGYWVVIFVLFLAILFLSFF